VKAPVVSSVADCWKGDTVFGAGTWLEPTVPASPPLWVVAEWRSAGASERESFKAPGPRFGERVEVTRSRDASLAEC